MRISVFCGYFIVLYFITTNLYNQFSPKLRISFFPLIFRGYTQISLKKNSRQWNDDHKLNIKDVWFSFYSGYTMNTIKVNSYYEMAAN